jgi:hypothetical protein
MSNVLRFGTSNTTIVAVGSVSTSADPLHGPISFSDSTAENWTSPTVPVFMRGSTVVLNDILFAGNTWVTCGLDSNGANFIAYSPNLSNWVKYTNPEITPTIRWSGLAYNENAWTIAGADTVTYATKILSLFASPWPTQEYLMSPGVGIQFGTGGTPLFSRVVTKVLQIAPESVTGSVFIPPSSLTFVEPVQSNFTLYQYVPYTFPVRAIGSPDFIFYYATNVPIGFNFVQDAAGAFATLIGTSPSNTSTTVNIYAKTANSSGVLLQVNLNTIIPYFTRSQLGAGAYTAIVRKHVDADAAQNARDNRVFPEVNPLAGPFMAPRAPDVITLSNCFLGLCRKPCPTCRTMM